jgi:hypothetical protein
MFGLRNTKHIRPSTIQYTFIKQHPLQASFIIRKARTMATSAQPAASNAANSQETKAFPSIRFADVSSITKFLTIAFS